MARYRYGRENPFLAEAIKRLARTNPDIVRQLIQRDDEDQARAKAKLDRWKRLNGKAGGRR